MIRKLWIVLLILTIMLGPVSGFWSRLAQANTGKERRVMLCAAWPWSEGEWNKAAPPPSSDQDFTYSSVNPVQPKLQNIRQKPQKSFWSRLRFFLFNLKLLLGGK